jgi:carbamoyltransferase
MSQSILGIGGYFHDASACLVIDGQLIAAAEEERFTRRKHQSGLPHNAIAYCLAEAGMDMTEVDYISFYMKPWLHFGRRVWHYAKAFPRYPVYSAGYMIEQLYQRGWFWFELKRLQQMGAGKPQIRYVSHHQSHAASTFFVSPFDEAAILIVDGLGEWSTMTLYHGKGNRIEKLRQIYYPHSMGAIYGSVTNYLGFRTYDEYKVMGLASFGNPVYLEQMRDLIQLKDDGTYALNLDYFSFHVKPGRYEGYVSERFVERFGPARHKDEPLEQKHRDMAASLQALLEESVLHLCEHLQVRTGSRNLCLAGGVALNSVMNHRLIMDGPFDDVYIQPAANDIGTSVGAAYYLQHQELGQPRTFELEHAYWGPRYPDHEILALLEETKLSYTECDDPADTAAELIAEGKIIGWYQDRMEWGPRALGSRSILADPTRADMTDIVNLYVKHREDFRPFAPSVLEEYGDEYFENFHPSPYMLEVFPVKDAARASIPAVVHVDGTARIQTVSRKTSPRYWQLIEAFRRITGVPVVLNTSFNVRGEPIVNTPRDALRCFFSTGMDALVMGRYLIDKGWTPEGDRLAPKAAAPFEVIAG